MADHTRFFTAPPIESSISGAPQTLTSGSTPVQTAKYRRADTQAHRVLAARPAAATRCHKATGGTGERSRSTSGGSVVPQVLVRIQAPSEVDEVESSQTTSSSRTSAVLRRQQAVAAKRREIAMLELQERELAAAADAASAKGSRSSQNSVSTRGRRRAAAATLRAIEEEEQSDSLFSRGRSPFGVGARDDTGERSLSVPSAVLRRC